MEKTLENPAQRLLQIVEAGRGKPQADNCRNVWRELLHVEEEDEPLLLSRIGKTMALIDQASQSIRDLPGVNPDRYLDWVPPLTKAFSEQNLNGEWKTFAGKINNHVVNYLNNTADILAAKSSDTGCDIESLRELSNSVADLVDEISASSLPPNVKMYMCSKLRAIQVAIDEYEITGRGPIREQVESAFGRIFVDKEFREHAKADSAAKKFWTFVGRVTLVVSAVSGTLAIAHEVQTYLPPMPEMECEAEGSAVSEQGAN